MRAFLSAALLLASATLATPAAAQDISADIARDGLARTQTRLAAITAPTPAERFALGGVQFLRSLETILQLRWKTGLNDNLRILPVFRLPIAENPAPDPFDPAIVTTGFTALAAGMQAARAPLTDLPPDEFAVTIRLQDLWFDLNADGTRMPGEGLLDIAGPMLLGWQWDERQPGAPTPVITFDRADADWLRAYTHLLSGLSQVILAYDPTEAIRTTTATRAAMRDMRALQPGDFDMNASFGDIADAIFTVARALDQQPDAARLLAAQQHFLAMIADNRAFWATVELETDNNAEWLPNGRQASGLGLDLPPETGVLWLAVLTDAEALLQGKMLAPYFWLDNSAGVNVARLFTEPRPIDLLGWVQGTDALPYLEKGPLLGTGSWSQFQAMLGGQAMLMTLYLN